MATLAATALRLAVTAHLDEFEAVTKVANSPSRDKGRIILEPCGPVEVRQGEGLGALLTLEEGHRRVHDYCRIARVKKPAVRSKIPSAEKRLT